MGATLDLIDLATGTPEEVLLPDQSRDNQKRGLSQIMIAGERQGGLLREAGLVDARSAPSDGIKELSINFRRPPSWTVRSCRRCSIYGYSAKWSLGPKAADPGQGLLFASTQDSIPHAISTVLRHSGALDPCDRKKMACIDFTKKSVHIGGVGFTQVDIYGEEGGETIYVGRIRNMTILVLALPFDPSQKLILDSVRFATS